MAKPTVRELVQMARQAGYYVVGVEQLRSNRWLLILRTDIGSQIALLVQARPLINSADVQDLADVIRLRQLDGGILLAYGGSFSPAAQRTHQELADSRLRLCTTLPPAARPEPAESQRIGAAAKSVP